MLRILLVGANGAMGCTLQQVIADSGFAVVAAGVDAHAKDHDTPNFPMYTRMEDVTEKVHVLIDFSHPSLLNSVLEYGICTQTPTVLCTTGYSEADEQRIRDAATKLAVFRSMNMSYGIHAMRKLVQQAVSLLWNDYDVELIEAHHNKKADAPSGTAKMLLTTIHDAVPNEEITLVHGREGISGIRPKNEIGVHALRGGTIAGEHTILFAGNDEMIEIKHTALSKRVFAQGALKAARFLAGKTDGLYDMNNL